MSTEHGEEASAARFEPPITLAGNPEWRLMRHMDSHTSQHSSGAAITDNEKRIIDCLKGLENDGIYSMKSGQEGDVLVRLTCQSPGCQVHAKVMRYPGVIALYTQNIHQNPNVTPERCLKKPALRYIKEHPDKPQQEIFKELKRRGIHNSSWIDTKNKTAIKNAKQTFRKKPVDDSGPFQNLHELKLLLDSRQRSIESLVSTGNSSMDVDVNAPLRNDATGQNDPLRNVIVLSHDIEAGSTGLQDWSKIIVTFPSALKVLPNLKLLWQTGQIQLETDYSKGFWKGNVRQIGQVGISDANKVYHPIIFGIQRSEDGPGSSSILVAAAEMVSRSNAIPISCLKDGSEVLQYGAKDAQLAECDCFAHMMRMPFTHGGGIRGSRGSLCRFLINCKDSQTNKRRFTLQDACDVLSYIFAFSHLTSLQDWETARMLFMSENEDLPNQVYKQYLPPCPRWGSACHTAGEVQSGQGLEKTWGYLDSAKKYHQKTHRVGDLESIFEAISEQEGHHAEDVFATEASKTKKEYSPIADYYNTEPGINHKSSAYYSLVDGRSLTRQEAIGNASSIGGYRVYSPNDAFTGKWKEEALTVSAGTDVAMGITIRQIQIQQEISKDRMCISSKPLAAKAAFMQIVGAHLNNNTPSPLEGEDVHSFLRRWLQ